MRDPADRLKSALADRYTIQREIGSGGMATVYVAHDLKHDREVAVKVLHPELAAVLGAERFLNEIRVTANLQHPHILPLHDSGEAEGFVYYVMPYAEGESLRAKLDREKELSVEETIEITKAVAKALDYAHSHNVIHRDIKPENILLQSGQPVVADFGIALAVSAAGGSRLTETGLSVGTPQYMSPEQAMGDRELDGRSDIYSLGCVVYEMLVGEPPFTGPTAQAIVAKVLTKDTKPVSASRKTVPNHVDIAIERALAKIPADRFTTADDLARSLADPGFARSVTEVSGACRGHARPGVARQERIAWIASLVALGITGLAAGYFIAPHGERGPAVYDVGLPDSALIWFTGGSPWGEGWKAFAVSRDARFAVYVARQGEGTELWYRSLVDAEVHSVPGTEGAYHPMLSPDGAWVAFFSGDRLKRVPTEGGVATTIAQVERPRGGHWASTDRILVSDDNGNRRRSIDPTTGRTVSDQPGRCYLPHALPDGERFLCSHSHSAYIGNIRDGSLRALQTDVSAGVDSLSRHVPGTHFTLTEGKYLCYVSVDGSLRATVLDTSSLTVGRSVTMLSGLRREGVDAPGQYAVTSAGTLVYVPGDNAEIGHFVKARDGELIETLPIEAAAFLRFDLSMDGQRLASVVRGISGQELWVYDVDSGHGERWLRAYYIGEPRWSPTGDRLIVNLQPGLGEPHVTVIGSPTATTPPDTLQDLFFQPSQFLADDVVLGYSAGVTFLVNLGTTPLTSDTLAGRFDFPSFSPNSSWLAYISARTGRDEVYLEPYPQSGHRYQVSSLGGMEPLWLSASQLVYRSGNSWYKVSVGESGDRPLGEPEVWFSDPRFTDTLWRSHLLAPDGDLIYVQGTGRSTAAYLRVIPNWVAQMKRAVDEANR